MSKAFIVLFAVFSAALGLLTGVAAVGLGLTAAPTVMAATVLGVVLALPVSLWRAQVAAAH